MYRTVIVDDDFLVRSYLKGLDSWQATGYEIIADVRDGEEALRVIKDTHPDVIITDISMPLMDGIELIRNVRHSDDGIYIIVLSCHDDFEYVKEAMKLGANEYVLKNSLDETTLYNLLLNSKHQMEHRKVKADEQERTKKLIKMGSQSLKYHFFNQLLSGTMTAKERDGRRREAGICGRYSNSAVVTMFIVNWSEMKSQMSLVDLEQYSRRFLVSLTEQMEELLGEECDFVEVIYLGEGIFCCFLDLSSMRRSSLMKQKLTSVASACFRCCKKETFRYGIGVSNICIGEDGIRQAYQQAREMIKLSFYEDSDILYFDSQKEIGRQLPPSAEELLDKINSYVSGRRQEELHRGFHRVIEDCKKCYTDSKLVIHWLKEMDKKVKRARSHEEYNGIVKIKQLHDIYEDYCRSLLSNRKNEMPEGVCSVVKQAIEYINGHFKKPIGLGEVAEEVGLNPAYLSCLFKQEMGIGFSNYLLECRMEHAKGLLVHTNYKIKDVASEAGFNDYHYFSKAFKKLNGCGPVEFRRGTAPSE